MYKCNTLIINSIKIIPRAIYLYRFVAFLHFKFSLNDAQINVAIIVKNFPCESIPM